MSRLGRLTLFAFLALCLTVTADAQDAPLWPAEREVITPENASRLTLLAELEMPTERNDASLVMEVEYSSDGHVLAAYLYSGEAQHLRIWDAESGTLLQSIDTERTLTRNLLFSPDDIALVSQVFEDDTSYIRFLDMETGENRSLRFVLPRERNCPFGLVDDGLAFATNDTLVAYGYDICTESYMVWNPRNGNMMATIGPSRGVILHTLSGRTLMFKPDNGLWLQDLLTGEIFFRSEYEGGTYVAISPDESVIALATNNGQTLKLLDRLSGLELNRVSIESRALQIVTFSPDGHLLVAGDSNFLYIWDLASGEFLTTLDNPNVNSIAFSPDGTLMAVGGLLDVVRVWAVPA